MSTTSDLIAQLRAMVALTNETPRIPALPRALATDAANRLDELERENAALREALKPFADFPQYEDRRLVVETAAGTRLMGIDFRRVREALEERKP